MPALLQETVVGPMVPALSDDDEGGRTVGEFSCAVSRTIGSRVSSRADIFATRSH